MTPVQRSVVAGLICAGFSIVVECQEIVRMARGADKRVVFKDGSQKRGHHKTNEAKQ